MIGFTGKLKEELRDLTFEVKMMIYDKATLNVLRVEVNNLRAENQRLQNTIQTMKCQKAYDEVKK